MMRPGNGWRAWRRAMARWAMPSPLVPITSRFLLPAIVCLAVCTPSTASEGPARALPWRGDSAAWSAEQPETGAVPEAAEVVAAPARDGELILWVSASGVVQANAVMTLRADVAGTIARVHGREGGHVRAGDPLVVLEAEPFDLQAQEAEARLAEAELRMQDSYLPESLVTGHAPSAAQRQARQIRAGVLSARLVAVRARRDRAHATIRSPMTGTIDRLMVGPGEQLAVGQPIARLVDAGELIVETHVLEHDLPRIRRGTRARIHSVVEPARPRMAQVEAVLPTVDTVSHAGRVLVRLSVPGSLRPGMSVEVELEGERLATRRLVPSPAILERDGRALVFVLRDGRAHWTFVVPGRSNGIDTELLPDPVTGAHALAAGDVVLVDGHQTLTHEAPVRAVAAARASPP